MAEAGNVWVSVLPSLSGFKAKVNAQLKGMGDFTVNVGVNVDTKQAEAEIKDATKDQKVNVGVNVDDKAAAASLDDVNRKASSIDGRKLTMSVAVNTAKAISGLATVAVAANAIDKRTLSPKINLDTRGILGDLARVGSAVLGTAATITKASAGFSLFSMAGAAAVKAIGSLGPVVSGAVGAAALLPSVMTAGAATAGTLAIGLHGVGAAITNAFDPTKAKQFNQAMAGLSPNAKAAVTEIQSLGGQFKALQMDVQDKLFANVSTTIGTLAKAYLPMARTGFGAMAVDINDVAVAMGQWLAQDNMVAQLRGITDNVTLGFHNLLGAVLPAAQGVLTLVSVGSGQLPFMANAIHSVATQFNVMVQSAAASGALAAFFQNATIQLGYLFQILGNVGIVLFQVFSAGSAAGGNLLSTLLNITGAMAEWTQSAQGMSILTLVFKSANAAMAAAQPLLAAIGQALATTILPALAGALPAIGAAFGALAPAIAPLGAIIAALAPVLAVIANVVAQVLVAALTALAPIVAQLAPLFAAWAVSIGQQLVGAIQVLAPLLLTLATFMGQHPALVLGVVSALGTLFGAWTLLRNIVGAFLTPLTLIRVGMLLFGVSISSLLGPVFSAASAIGGWITKLSGSFSITSLMTTALRILGQVVLKVVGAVLSAMGPLGWMVMIFTTLYSTNEQFRNAANLLFGTLMQLVGAVVGSLQPAFGAFSTVMSTLSGVLSTVLGAVAAVLSPVLSTLAGWIQTTQPVLVPLIDAFIAWKVATLLLGPAITVAKAAMAGWQAIMDGSAAAMLLANIQAGAMAVWGYAVAAAQWVATAATGAWSAATFILDAAMSPLGLTILAIVAVIAILAAAVYLIITNWSSIAGFFVGLWNTVSGTFVTAWTAIWGFLQMVWTSVLQPIFSAIGTALAYIGIAIMTILVAPFVIAWNIISSIVMAVWNGVLSPIWYGAILPALTILGAAFIALWTNFVVPAWNGIMAALGAAWAWINSVVFVPIQNALTVLGAFFVMLWTNFVVPAWNGIMAAAGAAWAWLNGVVFVPIQNALNVLGSFFVMLWTNFVVPAWNGIMAAAGAAWNWLNSVVFVPIQNALNVLGGFFMGLWTNYVVPAWNGIMSAAGAAWNWINSNVFGPISTAVHAVGQAFQDVADWIARAWDSIKEAARAPIQWVVDVVYNNGIRTVWNGIAGLFGMAQLGPVQMATGGVVPGYAPGKDTVPAVLSRGEGVLVPEAVRGLGPAFVGWANSHFSRGRSSGGIGTGYSKGGVAHFADGGVLGGIEGFFSGAVGFFTKVFTDPVGAVKDLFSAVLGSNNQTPGAGHPWTEAPKQIVPKTIDAVVQKVKDWIASLASMGGGGNWAPVMGAALAMTGQPQSLIPVGLRRLNQESGGNPTIVNTTDSNWAKGTPSVGLMQVIGPTYASNKDPRRDVGPYLYGVSVDPLSNILASIHYTLRTYGSLPAGWNRAGGYDVGGLASGSGLMLKSTIAPERVLSPQQTAAFESLVPLLSTMRRGAPSVFQASDYVARDPRSGATIIVNPSARMDETDLANKTLHRLDWEMGLVQ